MSVEKIELRTLEGTCNVQVFSTPSVAMRPAIIMYMDAFGIRPVLLKMAERLADQGYLVLLPDLYYRAGPYATLNPEELLKGDYMSVIGPLMASTDNLRAAEDTEAVIRYIKSRPDYNDKGVGVVGFCMGGAMALTASAFCSSDIRAVASFHAGNLIAEGIASPHLYMQQVKARVYIAGADNDAIYPPEMAARFTAILQDARVDFRSEIYEGAEHGFMKPDIPAYNMQVAERGWKEMYALFRSVLQS